MQPVLNFSLGESGHGNVPKLGNNVGIDGERHHSMPFDAALLGILEIVGHGSRDSVGASGYDFASRLEMRIFVEFIKDLLSPGLSRLEVEDVSPIGIQKIIGIPQTPLDGFLCLLV